MATKKALERKPAARAAGRLSLMREICLVVLIAVRLPLAYPADLPDYASPRNLEERAVACDLELAVRVGLAKVAHRSVIHEVRTVIRPELEIHWAIDPVNLPHERLLECAVVGKPLELELERLTRAAEVDELDVVPLFRNAIAFREPEVPLAAGKGRTALDRAVHKGIGHEVKPDNCDVRWLKGQGRRDWLGWERENGLHRLTDDGGRIIVAGAPDRVKNRLS